MSRSEGRFRALVESGPDIVGLFDEHATIGYVSSATRHMLGYSPEELVGRNGFAFVHPDDLPSIKSAFGCLLTNPQSPLHVEYRSMHKDGSWRYMEVNGINRLADPSICAIIGHFRDVTERKAREETLRRAEQKYRSLFENAVEGIFQTTPDGSCAAVNPALARMLGYESPEELMETVKDIAVQVYACPERRAEFKQAIEENQQITGFSCEMLRKDGSTILASVNARTIRDEEGHVLYYEGSVEDVTERRKLEEQYRHAQKMEAVGRLAGGVAHDFNNLLTIIRGYCELFLPTLEESHPLNSPLNEIFKAADKAIILTRQLLTFSRKQVLLPVVLDLNQVIQGMEEMLRRLIGEDIAFTFVASTQPWKTKADAGQIEQVLMNLVINARDAMPLGGKLRLATSNVVLDEGYVASHPQARPGEYVLLSITDTGCGIEKEIITRIFEPFFTTKGPAKGTGLGLAIVYGVVKQAGGHVDVYSEPGTGTTFKIYLPRDREGISFQPHSVPEGEVRGGTETLLLVEDDDGVRALAKSVLVDHGYTVLEARNGVEALARCEEETGRIALLITDVVMPRMGGRQLAQEVATSHPRIKVVYMSGYTEDAIVHHGVLEDGIAFLQKPFAPRTLAHKIREELDRE